MFSLQLIPQVCSHLRIHQKKKVNVINCTSKANICFAFFGMVTVTGDCYCVRLAPAPEPNSGGVNEAASGRSPSVKRSVKSRINVKYMTSRERCSYNLSHLVEHPLRRPSSIPPDSRFAPQNKCIQIPKTKIKKIPVGAAQVLLARR